MNIPIDTVVELLMRGVFDDIDYEEGDRQTILGVCVVVGDVSLSAKTLDELRAKVREHLETLATENSNAAD